MIEICNRHAKTGYADSDYFIPIPPSALRDIYAHIVNCCCFPKDKYLRNPPYETEWSELYERNAYEKSNLLNADKLHDLILTLK